MEQIVPPELEGQVTGFAESVFLWATNLLDTLLRPWVAYQIAIAIGILVAAQLLRAFVAPRLHNWMRTREGWPTWRMRVLVVLHKRLRSIFFVLLITATVAIMREVTWPSRSYVLAIIANLAMAWLVVALATRLIRNKPVRTVVRYGAWAFVTLNILGLTEEAVSVLDGLAINLGELRVSAWLVIQAAFTLGLLFFLASFASRSAASRIEASEEMSPSMRVLLVKLLQIAFFGLAVFIGLRASGIDLTGLAVLSGAIGVGLGFGLQKVVANLVSGSSSFSTSRSSPATSSRSARPSAGLTRLAPAMSRSPPGTARNT